jgi:hypothetical protein
MVGTVNMENKILTFERLFLSLKTDKIQLCTYIGLYVGLFVILYLENDINIAILGSMVPLAIGVNSLLLMDLKYIIRNFSIRKSSNLTLIVLVMLTNGTITWFAWPHWLLVLILWLIPLVLKFGIDIYLKYKS